VHSDLQDWQLRRLMDELQPSIRAAAARRNTAVRQPTEGTRVGGSYSAVATADIRTDEANRGPTDPNQQTSTADAVRRLGFCRSETKRSPTRLVGGPSNWRGGSADSDGRGLGRQAHLAEFYHHQERSGGITHGYRTCALF